MADTNTPADLALMSAVRVIIARNVILIGATCLISLTYLWLEPAGAPSWIVPILVLIGLWLVLFGLRDREDYQAMLRVGPPQPGQWSVVCGTARALGKDESDILVCRFQVFDEDRGKRTEIGEKRTKKLICRYDGFYLSPMGIETESTMVRLAGFPDLVHLEKTALPKGLLSRAESAAYSCPYWLPKSLAREITLMGIRDRAEIALHYGREPEASRGKTNAWIIRAGDQVCVFGHWKDGALLPSKNRPRGLPVYSGSADVVRERLSGDSSAFLILGAVFLTIALGLAIWSLI